MSLTYNYQTSAGQMGAGANAGNASQLISISGTINATTESAAYAYDNVGRLVTSDQTSNEASAKRRFAYDRWGNRTGVWDAVSGGNQIQTIVLQQSGGRSHESNHERDQRFAVNYTYDAVGNVTNDGAHTYTYVDGGATAQSNHHSGSSEPVFAPELHRGIQSKILSSSSANRQCVSAGPRHDLDLVFSLQHERVAGKDNTVKLANLCLQIERTSWRSSLAGCRVKVHQHSDDTFTVVYAGRIVGRYTGEGEPLEERTGAKKAMEKWKSKKGTGISISRDSHFPTATTAITKKTNRTDRVLEKRHFNLLATVIWDTTLALPCRLRHPL